VFDIPNPSIGYLSCVLMLQAEGRCRLRGILMMRFPPDPKRRNAGAYSCTLPKMTTPDLMQMW